jgi:Tol biopolymer transport system component
MTGQRFPRVRGPALVLAAALLVAAAAALPAAAASPASASSPAAASRVPAPHAAAPAASVLAFIRTAHVWRIGSDGKLAMQLTKGTAEDSIPVWSADGQTVAFVRSGKSGLNATVRTVPGDGAMQTPVLLYKSAIPKAVYLAITGLAYTPDGKTLTFAESWATGSPGDVGRCRVVSYDLASGKTKVLLSRNGGFGPVIGASWQLSWAPDGKTLAVAQSGQDSEGGQTWLFTPSSGSLLRLGTNQASFADWSPTETLLLLSTFTQSSSKIQRVSVAGKPLGAAVAKGGGWQGDSVNDGRYSPDGATVAYTYTQKGGAAQVWLIGAGGESKRKLTSGSQPAWK